MPNKLEVEGKEILIKSSNGTMAVIPKDKVSMVKGYIDSGNHGAVDKFVSTLKEFKHENQKAGDGLYTNIHAKRARIAAGSGERMRKVGEAGAPTASQFKQAAKTAKAEDGVVIKPAEKRNPIVVTNPNDPRLRAYQDSSFIKKNFNIFPHPKGYDQALKRVGQDPSADYFPAPEQPVVLQKPKIDVPEKIESKKASSQLTNPEVVNDRDPQMRPIKKATKKTPPALQYPAMNQNLLEKLKSKITGKTPMPYWTDKQGEKHYPHLGENNSEDVKQIKMLKSDLNPKVKEDADELKRIDYLLGKKNKQVLQAIKNLKK